MTAEQRELATLENFRRGQPSASRCRRRWPDARWPTRRRLEFTPTPACSCRTPGRSNRQLSLMARRARRPAERADQAAVQRRCGGSPRCGRPATGRRPVASASTTRQTIDGNKLVQPRVGFNCTSAPTTAACSCAAASACSRARRPTSGCQPVHQHRARGQRRSAARASPRCARAGVTCSTRPQHAAQPGDGAGPAANVDFLSPGLEQPSVWKANLAFDTELPRCRWSAAGGRCRVAAHQDQAARSSTST